MSAPMKRVNIDDEITRIGQKSVTLQVVERVDRDCFYTSDSSNALYYTDEGVTWIRGHHMLRSTAVEAAQAASALAAEKEASKGSVEQAMAGLGSGSGVPDMRREYEHVRFDPLLSPCDHRSHGRDGFHDQWSDACVRRPW